MLHAPSPVVCGFQLHRTVHFHEHAHRPACPPARRTAPATCLAHTWGKLRSAAGGMRPGVGICDVGGRASGASGSACRCRWRRKLTGQSKCRFWKEGRFVAGLLVSQVQDEFFLCPFSMIIVYLSCEGASVAGFLLILYSVLNWLSPCD